MNLDHLFIEFVHNLCAKFGHILTPILRVVTLCGEKAWLFLLISFGMSLRKKRRWVGFTAILAIFLGFVIADLILKPAFMRMRPYTASNLFQDYWVLAGSIKDEGYSMPSGHTVGAAAFFISLYITSPKSERDLIKKIGIVTILLMVISRCYFMHHYFSDCVVAIIVALVASYISKVIIRFIFHICKKFSDLAFFRFVLNFDIVDLFSKNG